MKDKDLEILLSEIRQQNPTSLQVRKWNKAVNQEIYSQRNPSKINWGQLIAASIIGFIVGALIFKTSKIENSFQQWSQNDSDNATIEYVLTKIN